MIHSIKIENLKALSEGDRFFEITIDMLAIAGYDGYFKRLNQAWEIVLGWSSEELMATPYFDFVHPEDREPTINEAKRISDLGEDCLRFENRYRCKDGSYKWLSWSSRPFPDESRIYAIARDITFQKETQNALAQARAEVQELAGLLPLCAWCKKIRDDQGYWGHLEEYLKVQTGAQFTHGICPDCKSKILSNGAG